MVSVMPFDPTNPAASPQVAGPVDAGAQRRREAVRLDEDVVLRAAQLFVEDALGDDATPAQLSAFLETFRRLEQRIFEENGL